MNQTAVANYVSTKLAGITGIVAVVQGMGDDNYSLPAQYPYARYSVGDPSFVHDSFGPAGAVHSTYPLEFDLVLGVPEMLAADAEAAKLVYADRLRAAFANDETLGGNCWNITLASTGSTIATFRDQGIAPAISYRLTIEDYTAANAPASGG